MARWELRSDCMSVSAGEVPDALRGEEEKPGNRSAVGDAELKEKSADGK